LPPSFPTWKRNSANKDRGAEKVYTLESSRKLPGEIQQVALRKITLQSVLFSRREILVATFIFETDLIQEAVTRQFELSGKKSSYGNENYNQHYQKYWVAYNGMLSFIMKYIRQTRYLVPQPFAPL